MIFNLKKKTVVGVSVTPELGLEVAQVDFASKTVLKYATKQLAYDNARREIVDLDIFKETLTEMLLELQIPKGTELVLNIPSVAFNIADYPASLTGDQVQVAIEEELQSQPLLQNTELVIDAVRLPSSTLQFNKILYAASQKVPLIEIAMAINEMGYVLAGIDTSVNSTLNALIYNQRVSLAQDSSWVLLLVEGNCCRVATMQGPNYIDITEERLSIGEVLGDVENYNTVVGVVNPILKNIPSQRLLVVSKTNIISAKVLATKLAYNGQIIHLEANAFAPAPYLEVSPSIDENDARLISLDVIGAAIQKHFVKYSSAPLNLFNESLGDVFTLQQPPVLSFGSLRYEMSMDNMLGLAFFVIIIAVVANFLALVPLNAQIATHEESLAQIENEIAQIDKFLKDNENISAELFDEGDEIRIGLVHNKGIYSYYTIVGTEIPKKLWLTSLKLGDHTTIEGQADNLESVYGFFRNIKDYNPESKIKLQKLGLAANTAITPLEEDAEGLVTDSVITSMNADYYEFKISDAPEVKKVIKKPNDSGLPELEPLN